MKSHQLLSCGAFVVCIIALAFIRLAPQHTAAASPAPGPVTAMPLFRLYHRDPSFHFYTLDGKEKAAVKAQPGWTEEQQEGYAFPVQVPGTVPLYRLTKSEFGGANHFYTIDGDEAVQAAKGGWKADPSPCCYVSPTHVPGTVALFRLYLPYVAPQVPEASWLDKLTGAGAPFCTCGGSGDDHFYTIDKQQKSSAISQGYQFERAEAYVWPQPITIGTSAKPAPPAPLPESYYSEQLLNFGCSKTSNGVVTCPTKSGYFDCEYYHKQGKVNVSSCAANFDLASFNKIESKLVDSGCKRFAGRPGEYICQSWSGGEACDAAAKLGNGLITKCFTPRRFVVASYQKSFGREPNAKELQYWSDQINANHLTYATISKDLTAANSQWLKTEAGSGERKGLVNRSYYEAFGRYPTVDELNYTTDVVASKGTSYADLVMAHVRWMTGGNAQQNKELRSMIARAFASAKKPEPSETQFNEWTSKVNAQKLTFAQLVVTLKS